MLQNGPERHDFYIEKLKNFGSLRSSSSFGCICLDAIQQYYRVSTVLRKSSFQKKSPPSPPKVLLLKVKGKVFAYKLSKISARFARRLHFTPVLFHSQYKEVESYYHIPVQKNLFLGSNGPKQVRKAYFLLRSPSSFYPIFSRSKFILIFAHFLQGENVRVCLPVVLLLCGILRTPVQMPSFSIWSKTRASSILLICQILHTYTIFEFSKVLITPSWSPHT